ncbi:MAG TPA: polymer-forming cytoskeletal protein [Thermomicrobiales bacterium]|jgi:cytoskeletal protein CcmA (bactofilin family)|nr:polymer-forming cytoskeletal protein [Thermomicrobiales bacterium]
MASRPMEQGAYRGFPTQAPTDAPDSMSVIDQYSNFDGTYHSTRDLRIEGQVKGTIECQGTLHIAQGANVNARVEAENISVAGELEGEITCRGKLQLLPSGRVTGKINTVTLVIHEGAFYEGDLQMGSQDRGFSSRARRTAIGERGAALPGAQREETSNENNDAPSTPPNTFIRRFGGQEQQFDANRPNESAGAEQSDE